jgi:hypothetical protein
MSALPPKADMCGAIRDVRFGPIADMVLTCSESQPMTQSEHYGR